MFFLLALHLGLTLMYARETKTSVLELADIYKNERTIIVKTKKKEAIMKHAKANAKATASKSLTHASKKRTESKPAGLN